MIKTLKFLSAARRALTSCAVNILPYLFSMSETFMPTSMPLSVFGPGFTLVIRIADDVGGNESNLPFH